MDKNATEPDFSIIVLQRKKKNGVLGKKDIAQDSGRRGSKIKIEATALERGQAES